jgi:hypothetical protein
MVGVGFFCLCIYLEIGETVGKGAAHLGVSESLGFLSFLFLLWFPIPLVEEDQINLDFLGLHRWFSAAIVSFKGDLLLVHCPCWTSPPSIEKDQEGNENILLCAM